MAKQSAIGTRRINRETLSKRSVPCGSREEIVYIVIAHISGKKMHYALYQIITPGDKR
jgi:hypothetical protein